jgi:hypothetical protein
MHLVPFFSIPSKSREKWSWRVDAELPKMNSGLVGVLTMKDAASTEYEFLSKGEML